MCYRRRTPETEGTVVGRVPRLVLVPADLHDGTQRQRTSRDLGEHVGGDLCDDAPVRGGERRTGKGETGQQHCPGGRRSRVEHLGLVLHVRVLEFMQSAHAVGPLSPGTGLGGGWSLSRY